MSYSLKPMLTQFFTEIEIMKKIRMAVDFSIMTVESESFSEPSPSLILGKPGTGKTAALLKIASEDERFIYAQASEGDRKLKGLLKSLLEAMEIHHDRRFASDLEELVVFSLERRNFWSPLADHIILVDEYQSYDLRAIRELMRICEHAHVPLILAGNEEKLKATQVEKTAIDQIVSRIGITVKVPDFPTATDCQNIGLSYNTEGKDAYDWLIEYGQKLSLRKLIRVLNTCHNMIDGKGGIRLHHLEEATPALQLAG